MPPLRLDRADAARGRCPNCVLTLLSHARAHAHAHTHTHTATPSRYWQTTYAQRAIVPVNMLGQGEKFLHAKARMLFGSNVAYQVWQRGTKVPSKLVEEIVAHIRQ